MKNTNIKRLLGGMICSECGADFEENSFKTMRKDDGLFVLQIKCKDCDKGFGMAFLGLGEDELLKSVKGGADEQDEPGTINYDDVLDAHNYFKDAEANWSKFVASKQPS